MKRLLSLVLLLCLLTAPLGSFAQDTGTGTPAFNSFSHAGGGIDTINLGNLNVHMEVPIRSLGAYGPPANAEFVMDSLVGKGSVFTPPTPPNLQKSTDVHVTNITHSKDVTCSKIHEAQGVIDHRNTYHDTPLLSMSGCNITVTTNPGSDGWSIMGTTNSSDNATFYAISPSGYVHHLGTITDAHGNTVTATSTSLTDALGNTVVSTATANTVTYPGPNSTTSPYTLGYTPYQTLASFGCATDQTVSASIPYLTRITFPDQSTMSFTYETNGLNASYKTGRIASVRLRTGATINYDYTGFGTHGINCSDGSTAGFKKTTPDGFWTFTHSAPNGPGKLSTTTVKAPSGDVTTYLFSGNYATQIYDVVNTTTICYNGVRTSCTNRSTPPTLPMSERDVYTAVGGMTSSALKVFLYDTYSRLTDVKTYNSGGVIGGANFVTDETFAYGSWSGSNCSVQNETVQGVAVPITGLICYNTVWTPGVGSPVSDMTRKYYANTADVSDEGHLIGGIWRNTHSIYDSLGRLTDTQGPNGEDSTIAYSNCPGNKLPGTFTSKVSGSLTLTTIIDSMDCTGELPLHSLDANNNGTTISYSSPTVDPFWRPTSITDAAGTTTAITYNSPTRTTTSTSVTAGSVKEFVETLDSMGRPSIHQQKQGPSSTQYNSVETDYDINGRVSRVTTPYPAGIGGGNGTIVSTLYAYDGVNRPKSITSPNGAVKSFTYTASASARDTLVSLNAGPNGEQKQTQSEYDGLGRVTSVCEVTSTSTYGCGQTTAQTGFFTKYSYSGPGNLLSITQNVGGATTQTRSFTYENSNTGRMLTAQTPEAGTFHLAYDSDGVCGAFVGAVVKTVDNGGGTTCLQYDLLHRLTLKTYTGLNSAVTPSKTFVYDSTTNPSINCPTGNQLGRLAEVSTGTAGVYGNTDEGFCYDVVGNTTDEFSFMNGTVWVHSAETYFPTGIPKTLAVGTQPTITYGLDSMARIYSANASSGQNPLASVTYNTAGLPTAVNFGSGDSSSYGWLNGVGPMNSATYTVGSSSITNTLTWNPNGTLQKLVIVDPLNAADAQTCTYSYDDLQRILTDNCGSTKWSQTFSYDPFGNVKKTGNPGSSWLPVYDQTTNRYQSFGATYDANGRLTNDTFDSPIGWDIEGNIVTQTSTSFAYDGLGRSAGSVIGGVWTNYIYAPDGGLFATADNSGNIKKEFVPLPMTSAVYSSAVGGALEQYRRNDWQGSVRVASTPTKTLWKDIAYGAFGEPYSVQGSTNYQFAGLNSDIASGTEQASLSRRYHPGQGRWISPDGGIPNILNPQTFNAYHYALNSPTNSTDPSGADDIPSFEAKVDIINVDASGTSTFDFGSSEVQLWNSDLLASDMAPVDLLGSGAGSDTGSGDISNLEITGGVSGTADLNSGSASGISGPAGGASGSWDRSLGDILQNTCNGPCNNASVHPLLGFVGGVGEAEAVVGEFSIIDWTGYPEGVPRPEGPFRLLEGAEYKAARRAADSANDAMHAADPTFARLHIHEIHPVKFGGNPTATSNKIVLPQEIHREVTLWWNALQRSLSAAR